MPLQNQYPTDEMNLEFFKSKLVNSLIIEENIAKEKSVSLITDINTSINKTRTIWSVTLFNYTLNSFIVDSDFESYLLRELIAKKVVLTYRSNHAVPFLPEKYCGYITYQLV